MAGCLPLRWPVLAGSGLWQWRGEQRGAGHRPCALAANGAGCWARVWFWWWSRYFSARVPPPAS